MNDALKALLIIVAIITTIVAVSWVLGGFVIAVVSLIVFFIIVFGILLAIHVHDRAVDRAKEKERLMYNEWKQKQIQHIEALISDALETNSNTMMDSAYEYASDLHYVPTVYEFFSVGRIGISIFTDAYISASGITEKELDKRRNALFRGAEAGKKEMNSQIHGPIGILLRVDKSVKENYQIGLEHVKSWGYGKTICWD